MVITTQFRGQAVTVNLTPELAQKMLDFVLTIAHETCPVEDPAKTAPDSDSNQIVIVSDMAENLLTAIGAEWR